MKQNSIHSHHQPDYLIVSLTQTFTTELERVRITGFGERYGTNLIDEADLCSHHIMVRGKEDVLATIRITPVMHSVLHQWSAGRFPVHKNCYTAELTRGSVLKKYQGLGIFKLIVLEALLYYPKLDFHTAIAALRIHSSPLPFFLNLGFVETGQTFDVPAKLERVALQPVSLNIDENLNKINMKYQTVLQQLAMKGIQVESQISNLSSTPIPTF